MWSIYITIELFIFTDGINLLLIVLRLHRHSNRSSAYSNPCVMACANAWLANIDNSNILGKVLYTLQNINLQWTATKNRNAYSPFCFLGGFSNII